MKRNTRGIMKVAVLAVLANGALYAQPQLLVAQQEVALLNSSPSNINQYGLAGALSQNGTSAHVDWVGSPPLTAISECSTFTTLLFEHAYNISEATYGLMMGDVDPDAAIYHDNIVAQQSFTHIATMNLAQPGDTIAIKYAPGSTPTGHVMTVVSIAAWQPRSASKQAFLEGTPAPHPEITGFYDVTVIDSSHSDHGPGDTRYAKPGGIGQGVIRYYVDGNLAITGYTWSTEGVSAYESPAVDQHDSVVGRFISKPLPQAITLNPSTISNKTFPVAPISLSATSTSGLAVTVVAQGGCFWTGTTILANAGSCTLTATQPGDSLYSAAPTVTESFTVAKESQTLSFPSIPFQATNSPGFVVSATATSGLPVSFASLTPLICSLAGTTVSNLKSGICSIQATQAGDANHLLAAPVTRSVTLTMTTTKTLQTIAFTPIGNRDFSHWVLPLTATASSGLAVSFASITQSVCSVAGSTVTVLTAGICTVQATQPGNTQYLAAAPVDQSFEIYTAGQTVYFQPQLPATASVGTTTTVTALSTSGLTVTVTNLTPAVCTLTGSVLSFSHAGTCTVQATQAGNATYTSAIPVSASVIVM